MALKDPEKEREYQRVYREANRDALREWQRRHYEANRDILSEQKKRHYEANRDAIREQKKRYQAINRSAIKEQKRRYRTLNIEAERGRARNYRQGNREAFLASSSSRCALRSARKRKACPSWADIDAIKAVYARSAELRALGIDTHVDHIVALHATDPNTGEHIACGLHVHWNLRVILDTDNCSKGSKLTDDIEPLAILEWA